MKRIALFFALAVAAIACTPEETVTPEIKVVPAESELLLPTEGGELTIKFNTNVDWTASVKEADAKEWCSLSPATGKSGDNTLKVIALENEGTENRTVTVVITAMEATAEVVVTQLQKDALVLTGNKSFEVPYQGQNLEFAVSHNSELKAEADVEWITEVKAKAVEESKLTFAVAPNTGEARTGKITFTAGSLKEVVEVKQAAWALEFTVTPEDETKTFEAEGGKYEVTVAANVEYTVNVPENDWLTVADAEGVYTFTAAANTTPVAREVTVTIAPKDEKLAEAAVAIKMNQKGTGAKLEVSDVTDRWLSSAATSFELTVDANIEYALTVTENDWITFTEADGVYTFAIAENAGWDLRSVYVYVTPVEETYSDVAVSFAVFQNGHAVKMWTKTPAADFAGYDPSQKVRLAKLGEYILVANGAKVFALSAADGALATTYDLPAAVQSFCTDDAGNIVVATEASYGGTMNIYTVSDPSNPQPELLKDWNTANYYGTDVGNLRVKGNIKDNAVMTATVSAGAGGAALMWKFEDGECSTWYYTSVPYQADLAAYACTAPAGTTFEDGLFYIGYNGAANDLYYVANPNMDAASEWTCSYVTGSTWMENWNSISTAEWNGNKYAAILASCHFNYDAADAHLLNVNDPASAQHVYTYAGDYDVARDESWANTNWTGGGTYSDVLLVPTADALLMVYIDGNYGAMSCIAIQ